VLLMGGASLLLMVAARGSVDFLVVLYSINVFMTFSLSQLGMVRHWWAERGNAANWKRKISINGVGFLLTTFILITLSIVKFFGGQLVFRKETFFTRFLHNYAVFSLQRRFYQQGLPLLILPIRV
jgi:hypothetical protein